MKQDSEAQIQVQASCKLVEEGNNAIGLQGDLKESRSSIRGSIEVAMRR